MTEDRCEKTDLFVSQCAHCQKHPDPFDIAPAKRPLIPLQGRVAAIAAFTNTCPRCSAYIYPGSTIYLANYVWVCTECGENR